MQDQQAIMVLLKSGQWTQLQSDEATCRRWCNDYLLPALRGEMDGVFEADTAGFRLSDVTAFYMLPVRGDTQGRIADSIEKIANEATSGEEWRDE